MSLELNNNYFPAVNGALNEIQNAVNTLEASIPTTRLILRGLVSQAGTAIPTVTILENTTGKTLSGIYNDVGDYYLAFSSQITGGPSFFYTITPYQTLATVGMSVDSFGIAIGVAYQDGIGDTVPIDGMLFNRPFEVVIY